MSAVTVHADLASYHISPQYWDGILELYCHIPPTIRTLLQRAVVSGLKLGGVFVLKAFCKEQLAHGTGGPSSLDMLMSLDAVIEDLRGLALRHALQI